MNITGMQCTPLILGKVQIGAVHNDQRDLIIEELFLRGISASEKEKIIVMKKLLIDDECEKLPAAAEEKKCFYPELLTAAEWSKDALTETIEKINLFRSGRANEQN